MYTVMSTDLARVEHVERERVALVAVARAERARSREHARSHPPQRRLVVALRSARA